MIRIKTVEYCFPPLSSLVNNTLTSLSNITISIPESSVTFHSVVAELTLTDTITATGGTFTKRLIGLQLDASGYTTVDNTTTLTNSAENISLFHSANFLSLFQASWSGTSMTASARVHINQSTGSTPGASNVCLKLVITYSYDDSSSTQLKTIRIPFESPLAGLNVALTTYDTVPNLSNYLSESGVSIKDCFLQIEGNTSTAASAVDLYLTGAIGSTTFSTDLIESALASDSFFRYNWKAITGSTVYFDTGSSSNLQLGCSVANKMNHMTSCLYVTYTFDATNTTRVLNSLLLPMEFDSPMGGITVSEAQKANRLLWIQEPGTITTTNSAFYLSWDQIAAITNLNFKVSGQDYFTYTNTAGTVAGGCSLQRTCDDVLTLSRGKNTLSASVYRTDTVDLGMNIGGYWIINYYSDKYSGGIGAHNSSVRYALQSIDATAAVNYGTVSSTSPPLPSGDYFLTSLGACQVNLSAAASSPQGVTLQVERLSAEGGPKWEAVYTDINNSDNEVGYRYSFSQARDIFARYSGDDSDRIDLFTSRRWRYASSSTAVSYWHFDLWYTIHQITYNITGNISGYTGDGSDISIEAFRSLDNEHLIGATSTTSGDFSFTWYDDTMDIFLTAKEGNRVGRSLDNSP